MARIATSVLPKPTSPHTSRSIGCGALIMSYAISSKVRCWSGVGWNVNLDANCAMRASSGGHGVRRSSCRSAYILTRSAATAHTFFAARSLRFSHDLRERRPSSRTVPYSPTSSNRLKSLRSSAASRGAISRVPSLKRTLSAFWYTRVPLASVWNSVVLNTPSKLPMPYWRCTT